MSIRFFASAFIFAAFTFSSQSHAQFMTGPVASALGGAGRAAVDPGEVSYLNPAAIAHLQRYYISGNVLIASHPVDGDVRNFGAQLADGSLGALIPGAISYNRRNTDLENGISFTQQDIQLSIGSFVYDTIAAGLSVHRLIYRPSNGGTDFTQDNVTLGVLYSPLEWLGIGAVGYDLWPADESVPVGIRTVPTFAFGSHILIKEILRLRLDLIRPDKFNEGRRIDVQSGAEMMFRDDFAFRLGGYWRETSNQTYLTTGLGFRGPRLSVDYTFQRDVRTGEGSRHVFDMWLPF